MDGDVRTPMVVVHLNTSDRGVWGDVLRTVSNLLAESPAAKIEVVLQGPAVDMGRAHVSPVGVELALLAARDVAFLACSNSLKARAIPESELLDHVGVVPSAIGEVIRAQQEGMAYIKV